jgi:hypothetical protein
MHKKAHLHMVPFSEVVQTIDTVVGEVDAMQPVMSHFTLMVDVASMKAQPY